MARSFWRLFGNPRSARRGPARPASWARVRPAVEALGERLLPAVTATFSPGSGVLSVFGDGLDNKISLSRNAAGRILVNGGPVPVVGGTATVANTTLMQVFGQGGNDDLSLDESSGALPAADLFGGAGNDVLAGGSGADLLFVEAPASADDVRKVASRLKGHRLVFNWVEGGRTPGLPLDELTDLGFALVLFPIGALLAATRSVREFYGAILRDGTPRAVLGT